MVRWSLQDAKARFSQLVQAALAGTPQRVMRNGKDAVVIVSAARYDELTTPKDSIVSFFARSPHRNVSLEIARSKGTAREVEL